MSRSQARDDSANQNAGTHFNQNEPEVHPRLESHPDDRHPDDLKPDDNVKMDDSDSDDDCQAVLVIKWAFINDVIRDRG